MKQEFYNKTLEQRDIANGIKCRICKNWMSEVFERKGFHEFFFHPPGHPRICKDCKIEES